MFLILIYTLIGAIFSLCVYFAIVKFPDKTDKKITEFDVMMIMILTTILWLPSLLIFFVKKLRKST